MLSIKVAHNEKWEQRGRGFAAHRHQLTAARCNIHAQNVSMSHQHSSFFFYKEAGLTCTLSETEIKNRSCLWTLEMQVSVPLITDCCLN